MTSDSFLLDLQWAQLAHDERYHKDVVILPLGERVKHMALHMAKYVGYLAEIGGDDELRVARILTDAFIIILATANALNQDLAHDLGSGGGASDLRKLGDALSSDFDGVNSVTGLLRPLARHAGALAKACESLDHMEVFPFRQAMRDSNIALFKIIVAASAARGLDLANRYRTRLRVVEERSIFDRHIQAAVPVAS